MPVIESHLAAVAFRPAVLHREFSESSGLALARIRRSCPECERRKR